MEYPKMLFRDGEATDHMHWNEPLVLGAETLIVNDEEEELIAKEDGWREKVAQPSPLDHDVDGSPGGSLPRRGRLPKTE